MMSRDVKIIRTDRYYWIISIDDKIVQLSRYRYRIDLGVVEKFNGAFRIYGIEKNEKIGSVDKPSNVKKSTPPHENVFDDF